MSEFSLSRGMGAP